MIPVGSLIEAPPEMDEPGLHCFKAGAEELTAFRRDLEERTEPLSRTQPVLVK